MLHMASHVSTCMPMGMPIKWEETSSGEGKQRGKRKRKRKWRERRESKERKREGRRKGSRCSEGRNLLDQGVKSGDSMRGYTSRGRDSSYFGLLLAFGLLFWADFGTVLCHVNGMGWVYSQFQGLLLEQIWVEKVTFTGVSKMLLQPSGTLLHRLAQ